MLEIAVFADFHWTFSLNFVFFKNINDSAFLFVRSFVCSFTRSFAASVRIFIRDLLKNKFALLAEFNRNIRLYQTENSAKGANLFG